VLPEKITPRHFLKAKKEGRKIVMITAYDAIQAKIVDEAGVDGILVGDSLGMVVMGYRSTVPVTMSMIIHHLKAVLNASPKALVVADMPFLSYEISKEEALRNAGKLIKLGADAVKLEGGVEIIDIIEAMTRIGIPVMGHIGLNPQRYLLRGLRLRGSDAEDAKKVFEDAKALEKAGVFSIVIEFTTSEVAAEVTRMLKIPTICIGSGPLCDGQILVFHDVVGLTPNPPPFARKYINALEIFSRAVENYVRDVREGSFPGRNEYYSMDNKEYERFKKMIEAKSD